MSLLGIDVGTSGCKAAVYSENGQLLSYAYEEYDIQRPQPGWAELDSVEVWSKIKEIIQRVVAASQADPVAALAVSALGESMVPMSHEHDILGPSLLNFDVRGQEFLDELSRQLNPEHFYQINGNTLGNNYGLTKLLWIKRHQPELYLQAERFLLWESFVSFMLGAEAAIDYSLANRTLLFDLEQKSWSEEMLALTGLDASKLAVPVPSGTLIGRVSGWVADELGLPEGVSIVAGAHDQCANAVGCGVIHQGHAVYGMGTFICITPVFSQLREPAQMLERGLNTEHHAAPEKYVSFIYNQGGSLVKWFRDTFASAEHIQAKQAGRDIYPALFEEIPVKPSSVIVLPYFTTTGPPHFISDASGVISGLRLETGRGDILKGIIEGSTFYLKECIDALPGAGIEITDFRVAGGGSKSDAWLQVCADIIGKPFIRPWVTEAGTLGAAIIAGVGHGLFPSFEAGVESMVRLERTFEPNPRQNQLYADRYDKYTRLWPLMSDYLRGLNRDLLK